MSIASQLIANGLIAGALYALIASGFALVYLVLRFIHFAHGAVFMVGAFAAYGFLVLLRLPFAVAVALAVLVAMLLGFLMNLLVYKPLRRRKADTLALLLSSIGVFIFLQSLALLLFGAAPKSLGLSQAQAGVQLLGASVTKMQLLILLVAVLLLAALYIFLKKSRLGKAMRAVASDREVSSVAGINVERVYTATFLIGSALAGAAGILTSLEQSMEPNMGLLALLKGLTAAIVGGISSVPGAMVGGFAIGIIENVGIWFIPSQWKDAIAFVVLFVFLIIRPEGLFGVRKVVGT